MLCHGLLLGLRHCLCLGVEDLVLDLLRRSIDFLHRLGPIVVADDVVAVGGVVVCVVHRLKVVVYQHTIICHWCLS